jgi:DNA primase
VFLARISEESILEVKRALDIAEVVGSYFPLKRAGSNLKALCPFHQEKTASFNVRPATQTFHCFGCGKKGDLIGFVMEIEKVEYPEAIRILADKAGVTLRFTGGDADEGPGRREIARANEWAAGVFRGLLQRDPAAEAARDFLARRGVGDETAELFGIGYAMDSWDHLIQRARKAEIDERTLIAAGLAIPRENRGGCYDRFRHRVTFPIGDLWGKAIAFGARQLREEDNPKFLNSPETKIFSKGRGFYGLHLAKETLEETKTIYIVEGYLDVVIPYQAGVKGLVATLGTALTRDHLKVLRRYADKVVLVFDADAAGQKAAERGLDLLLTESVDIHVAQLPAGMDPDDVVLKQGADALRACLEKPLEIFDFLMSVLTARHGGETPAAKQRVVEEVLERIGQIPDPVKQELLLQQLSRRFGIEERTLRAKVVRRSEAAPAEAAPSAEEAVSPVLVEAARELLACAVSDPGAAASARNALPPERYPSGALRALAGLAYGLLDAGSLSARELIARVQDAALAAEAAEVVGREIAKEQAGARSAACLDRLLSSGRREESKARLDRLKGASPEEQAELLKQVMESRRKRPTDHGLLPGR